MARSRTACCWGCAPGVFVCVTAGRWGHEPLSKWEGAAGRDKGPGENFLLGVLKALLNLIQDARGQFALPGAERILKVGEQTDRRNGRFALLNFVLGMGVAVAGLLAWLLCRSRDVAVKLRIPKPHARGPKQALSGCGGVF